MASSATCAAGDCSRALTYQPPTFNGNAALLAFFAVLIPVALALGAKYRSLGFAITITTGLSLEVSGYVGRLLLHSDPNNKLKFALFIIGTTQGPSWICGAMFLIVPRIVAVYGEDYRSWRPVWYLALLLALTVASLTLEFAGSIVSTMHDTLTAADTGVRLLVVGLTIQLVALVVFVGHAIRFAIALRTNQHSLDPRFSHIYTSNLFRASIVAFTVAAALIIIRTVFRIMQAAEGFESDIVQAELLFLVLDGAAMLIATILLLVFFPARAMGPAWSETSLRRLSRQTRRLARPEPARLVISRPGPVHGSMKLESPRNNSSPRRANGAAPISQRGMVDSDNLW